MTDATTKYTIEHSNTAWMDEDGGEHPGWNVLSADGLHLASYETMEGAQELVVSMLIADGVVKVIGAKAIL